MASDSGVSGSIHTLSASTLSLVSGESGQHEQAEQFSEKDVQFPRSELQRFPNYDEVIQEAMEKAGKWIKDESFG